MFLRVNTLFLALLIIIAGCTGSQSSTQNQATNPEPEGLNTSTDALLSYQDEITVDFLRQHLTAFADDSMQGRETGTKGLEMAADYLAKQYKQIGLQPVGDENSYFQHFKLNATKADSVVFQTFNYQDDKKQLFNRSVAGKNKVGNYIRSFGGTDSLSGKIVFAGFGVNDEENNVSHLEGTDLKGKWVMVFQNIPHVVEGDTLINPGMGNRARFQIIFQKGAEGILLIPDLNPAEYKATARQAQSSFGKRSNMRLAYRENGASGGFNKGYNLIKPEMAIK